MARQSFGMIQGRSCGVIPIRARLTRSTRSVMFVEKIRATQLIGPQLGVETLLSIPRGIGRVESQAFAINASASP